MWFFFTKKLFHMKTPGAHGVPGVQDFADNVRGVQNFVQFTPDPFGPAFIVQRIFGGFFCTVILAN